MKSGAAWGHPLLLAWGLSVLLLPAPTWPDVYTWTDGRGVQHFVGDAAQIPEQIQDQARLFVSSTKLPGVLTAPAPPGVRLTSPEGALPSPPPTDQGALAVALAQQLGLAYLPTPPEAAIVLAQRGIVPPGGWLLEGPISPGWLADLARSLLAASSAGLIPHAPGEAFAILEALAAGLGVALVPLELPLPPRPPVVEVPIHGVIFESVVVPAGGFRHGRFFHHGRKERQAHRRPPTASRRKPAEGASGGFHRLGDGFHRLGSGFHRLGGSRGSPPRGRR